MHISLTKHSSGGSTSFIATLCNVLHVGIYDLQSYITYMLLISDGSPE